MSKILLFCCNIGFVAIYVLLWQICFVAIYALLCGEKIIQKLRMWRKNDKYQVCVDIIGRYSKVWTLWGGTVSVDIIGNYSKMWTL